MDEQILFWALVATISFGVTNILKEVLKWRWESRLDRKQKRLDRQKERRIKRTRELIDMQRNGNDYEGRSEVKKSKIWPRDMKEVDK